jgi:hypothetical protein
MLGPNTIKIGHQVIRHVRPMQPKFEGAERILVHFQHREGQDLKPVKGVASPIMDLTQAKEMMDPRTGPGFVVGSTGLFHFPGTQYLGGLPISPESVQKIRRGVMTAGRELEPSADGVELFYDNFGKKDKHIEDVVMKFKKEFLDHYAADLPPEDQWKFLEMILRGDHLARSLMPEEIANTVKLHFIKIIANEHEIEMNTLAFHSDITVFSFVMPLELRGADIMAPDTNGKNLVLFPTRMGSFAMLTGMYAKRDYPDVYANVMERNIEGTGFKINEGTIHRSPYIKGNRTLLAIFYALKDDALPAHRTVHPNGFSIRTSVQMSSTREK